MDEDTVGKSFDKGKLRIFAGALLVALFFPAVCFCASGREFELFDKGYEYFLSYQPEKSMETFKAFLKEFPQSSASDAALFWLGRCSVQLKSYEDAGKYFSEIKKRFPDSPFTRYAQIEAAPLLAMNMERERAPRTDGPGAKGDKPQPVKAVEEKKKASAVETARLETAGEVQKPHPSSNEAKKEETGTAAISRKQDIPVKRETTPAVKPASAAIYSVQAGAFRNQKAADRLKRQLERKGYVTTVKQTALSEGTRFVVTVGEFRTMRDAQEFAVALKKELGLYAFPVERERGGSRVTMEQAGAKKAGGASPKTREMAEVIINKTRYTVSGISESMKGSSSALSRVGVQAVPWRSGNVVEDFVNEQLLYDEAKRLDVAADPGKLNELSKRYGLSLQESEYVERYLLVRGLVDRKMKGFSEEGLVESLSVKFSDATDEEKVSLATKLQELARSGKPFEEISALYPGTVAFSVTRVGDLQDWLRDSIKGLKSGEVSVVWRRGGYMLLKPLEPRPSSGASPANTDGDMGKTLLKEWIEGLKKDRGVEIVYR